MRHPYIKLSTVSHAPEDRATRIDKIKRLRHVRAARLALPIKPVDRYENEIGQLQSYTAQAIKALRATLNVTSAESVRLEYMRKGVFARSTGTRANLKGVLLTLRERISAQRKERRELSTETGQYVQRASLYTQLIGGAHTEPGFWLKIHQHTKLRKIREGKAPRDGAAHVGLELEFCSPADHATIAAALNDAGLADHVQLKGDGSVRPKEGDYAHEIAILAKQSDVSEIVPRVTAVLNAAKSYVNASCGFHVHLDMRSRDPRHAWNNLRKAQALLYRMVPATRKKGRPNETRYCKPVRTTSYDRARRSGDRYVGINAQAMRSHGTLEVRLHSSTLDPVKVLNWTDLLLRIVDSAEIAKPINTLRALRKRVPIPDALAEYIKARVALFAPQHKGAETPEAEAA